jgi:2-amino-4-hydroxy-6-hydroxymethyldihydropteridine diphosphokinase
MVNSIPSSITAYLGLGSNLASPVEQIKSARFAIAALDGVKELAFSSLYHSLPMGPKDQPDYVNAVMAIATELSVLDLLHKLQSIESAQGRTRTGERWGARTLDLDILMYGDQCIDLPELTVPHPGIVERSFVLYPWHEIAPELTIPGRGSLAELLAACPLAGLKKLD